ncbi:MAG: hypothetical protein ACE5GX_00230 [Thermoanaerobaculia bacterium]
MPDDHLTYLKSDVPAGTSGEWTIETFEVRKQPGVDRRPECFRSPPGRYTRLRQGGTVFMTDLYDEWYTQLDGIREARRRGGEILVTGLGLGVVAESILAGHDSKVELVTVVEYSADVIRLVAPHLREKLGPRLEIVQAGAYEWLPPAGSHYTVGWHDIWDNPLDPDCLAEMDALESRYSPFCDWQSSWPRSFQREAGHTPAPPG